MRQQSFLNNEKILIFRGVTGVTFIDTDDVVYITADGNYSSFHFISGRVETVTALIGNIEAQLGSSIWDRQVIRNRTSYLAHRHETDVLRIHRKEKKEYRCEISRDKVKMLMDFMKNRFSEF